MRGSLLSVALSLGSPPPAVNRHRFSVEPGLSSTRTFRPLQRRGCPADWPWVYRGTARAALERALHAVNVAKLGNPVQRQRGFRDV